MQYISLTFSYLFSLLNCVFLYRMLISIPSHFRICWYR